VTRRSGNYSPLSGLGKTVDPAGRKRREKKLIDVCIKCITGDETGSSTSRMSRFDDTACRVRDVSHGGAVTNICGNGVRSSLCVHRTTKLADDEGDKEHEVPFPSFVIAPAINAFIAASQLTLFFIHDFESCNNFSFPMRVATYERTRVRNIFF